MVNRLTRFTVLQQIRFKATCIYRYRLAKKNTASLWFQETQMLVDTGCVTTTFHLSVLEKIREVYPLFLTATTTINVLGGSIDVQSGVIDIEFCGKEYIMRVNFANIPCIALIGAAWI